MARRRAYRISPVFQAQAVIKASSELRRFVAAIIGLLGIACLGVHPPSFLSAQEGAQAESIDLGQGWKWSPWFGIFNDSRSPWLFHAEHDWLFLNSGSLTGTFFFFDLSWGWIWTGKGIYPDVFSWGRNTWLRYEVGTTSPRVYFDYALGESIEFHKRDRFDTLNDYFNVSNLSLPRDEIVEPGILPDSGIPALDFPVFVRARDVTLLGDDDILMTVTIGGETRGYPLRILDFHEVVNDDFGDRVVAITYCPLCNSGLAFDREVNGRVLSFGVSRLLYRNNLLMYDRQTFSLWLQFALEGVSGVNKQVRLAWIPSNQMTWRTFRQRHPDAFVLSPFTGFTFAYFGRRLYEDYFSSENPRFPTTNQRGDLPNKAWVWGVESDGIAKAYPRDRLPSGQTVVDEVNGVSLSLNYDRISGEIEVVNTDSGVPVRGLWSFWFSWVDFFPDTLVWSP